MTEHTEENKLLSPDCNTALGGDVPIPPHSSNWSMRNTVLTVHPAETLAPKEWRRAWKALKEKAKTEGFANMVSTAVESDVDWIRAKVIIQIDKKNKTNASEDADASVDHESDDSDDECKYEAINLELKVVASNKFAIPEETIDISVALQAEVDSSLHQEPEKEASDTNTSIVKNTSYQTSKNTFGNTNHKTVLAFKDNGSSLSASLTRFINKHKRNTFAQYKGVVKYHNGKICRHTAELCEKLDEASGWEAEMHILTINRGKNQPSASPIPIPILEQPPSYREEMKMEQNETENTSKEENENGENKEKGIAPACVGGILGAVAKVAPHLLQPIMAAAGA